MLCYSRIPQIPTGYQDRSKISRAKSFTGSHPSRESSDERNFSHMMTRGYAGSDYSHGQNSKQEFRQRGSAYFLRCHGNISYPVRSHTERPVYETGRGLSRSPSGHTAVQRPQDGTLHAPTDPVPPDSGLPPVPLLPDSVPFLRRSRPGPSEAAETGGVTAPARRTLRFKRKFVS